MHQVIIISSNLNCYSYFDKDMDPIESELLAKVDQLFLTPEPRLNCYIADQVDTAWYKHWTLAFSYNNLPSVGASIYLVRHVVDNLEAYSLDKRCPS